MGMAEVVQSVVGDPGLVSGNTVVVLSLSGSSLVVGRIAMEKKNMVSFASLSETKTHTANL